MLRPAMNQIIKPEDNYYEFVVAVAKKARQIAAQAEEDGVPFEGKPVSRAVEMFANGTTNMRQVRIDEIRRARDESYRARPLINVEPIDMEKLLAEEEDAQEEEPETEEEQE